MGKKVFYIKIKESKKCFLHNKAALGTGLFEKVVVSTDDKNNYNGGF